MKALPPCRLFVLLARDAPLGVIFRRGPTKLTQLILWHTDMDTFELGDRHVGNFYPERSDLSPDGKLLIYFAANYTARRRNKGLPDTWTALSKPPWLRPLALWPNFGTYYGGGLFTSNIIVQVNQDPHAHRVSEGSVDQTSWPAGKPPAELDFPYDQLFWDHDDQFFTRMERNGWTAVEPYPSMLGPLNPDATFTELVTGAYEAPELPVHLRSVYSKPRPGSNESLVLLWPHRSAGYYGRSESPSYEVHDSRLKIVTSLSGAIWADWDQRGRLVYVQEGKLFTADLNIPGKFDPKEIADFTPLDKKRVRAPQSAGQW
ncbi:hypothetical protein [Armatimonas sp.]|uniref:hypothetical protein n=1 Tax=Armatimonas sp. TaxID=1872638 RepID=UPI0037539A95